MTGDAYDLVWLIGIMVTIVFLPSLTFFVVRLVKGTDKTNDLLTEMRVDYAGTKTELKDHIKNDAIHCKGVACKMARSIE